MPRNAPTIDDPGLALHAVWSGRSLLLWSEDAGLARLGHARRKGSGARRTSGPGGREPRRPARAAPPVHPFAATIGRLREMLEDGGTRGEASSSALLLPTVAGRPLASPDLRRFEPTAVTSRAAPRLAKWVVPALAFPPTMALDMLLALSDTSRPELAVGDSVRALARAVELALDLTARGGVLPAIVGEGERSAARWLSVPDADDAERIRRLAESLPPLCRAEARDGSTAGRDPGQVVAEAIGAFVDEIARAAVRDGHALPAASTRRRKPLAAPEAFIAALTSAEATIDAGETQVADLARTLASWHRSGMRQAGPVRTCFRLDPPDDGAAWRIEFLLQSREDPSLLVPAEQIWHARRRISVLHGTVEHPQERLLADLGHACRLYPELEQALETARPQMLETDVNGAHRFLAEAAPLLEQAGFGVLVPPWWRTRAARLGLRVRARPASSRAEGSGLLGLDGLVDYRYEVALGDDSLSAAELRELAALKVPLVRVRGRWVELRPAEIEAALRTLEDAAGGAEATVGELLRQGLGLEPSPSGLPIVAVEGDGWLGELLGMDRRVEPVPAPAGFAGSLRPYQERGLGWLAFMDQVGLGACLADDMGLGKTVQLLALLLAERGRPAPRRRRPPATLLICPMSVVGNWQREAERFAPGVRVHVHHGSRRLSGRSFAATVRRSDLVITTYALATRDAGLLGTVRWGRIALDEAQNIKNAETKQSRAIRALRAPSRVALTGTPVENRLAELWSIMEFCNPGLLGSGARFRQRFAVPIERYHDEDAADRLRRITAPFVLRRLKTDRSIIADLPDKIEMKVYCNLTREQATLYQAVVDDMLARIDASEGIERRGLVLATMMKLKQVCNHPAHLLRDGSRLDDRSGKLARLEEVLDEALAEGDRALCFTQFAEMGSLLRDHLVRRLGVEVAFLHGGIPKRARDEMVARFQSDGGPPVLLLSLKAGGVGLNLTAANHVIHFDRWWNPAVEDQATDRAFRIGQRRNVQVRKLVCVGTLEERIDRMIEDKRELALRIVGSGEGWLTELSTAQIRELVALSADAVAEG